MVRGALGIHNLARKNPMASEIDITKPRSDIPTAASIRANFDRAKTEIEQAQNRLGDLEANTAPTAASIAAHGATLTDHTARIVALEGGGGGGGGTTVADADLWRADAELHYFQTQFAPQVGIWQAFPVDTNSYRAHNQPTAPNHEMNWEALATADQALFCADIAYTITPTLNPVTAQVRLGHPAYGWIELEPSTHTLDNDYTTHRSLTKRAQSQYDFRVEIKVNAACTLEPGSDGNHSQKNHVSQSLARRARSPIA